MRSPSTCLVGVLILSVTIATEPLSAQVLLNESFVDADPETGLAPGWRKEPDAAVDYFQVSRAPRVYGAEAPSVRVDAPPVTLHYRLASPSVQLPSMNAVYEATFTLKVEMPDSPFQVDVIYQTTSGEWAGRAPLLQLVGRLAPSFRTYRVRFNPRLGDGAGRCYLSFGLHASRVLRQGRFWLDDVRLRLGGELETLDFYLRPTSVTAGTPVALHASATRPTAAVEVRYEGEAPRVVWRGTMRGLVEQPVPENVSSAGCAWPVSVSIPVGDDWPSGVYTVVVDDGERSTWETMIVSGNGRDGDLAVVIPTHTDQAYNAWGGKNFYGSPPTRTHEVSFERPTQHRYLGFYHTPVHLVRWLHREGIRAGVFSDHDLHHDDTIFRHYRAIVLTWHSEYWTGRMRNTLESFLANGGSLLCFSGNTMWWQTRLAGDRDPVDLGSSERLVCYKNRVDQDPYHLVDPKQVTGLWDELPTPRPPELATALSWRHGGNVNWSSGSAIPDDTEFDWFDGYGGYAVTDAGHWVFDGTGLRDGDTFGRAQAIVGYEVDGGPLTFTDGVPELAWSDPRTPPAHVLGHSACDNYYTDEPGNALMVIATLPAGGILFSGGTTGWCWGLSVDPEVQQVTRNLIERATRRDLRPQTPPPTAGVLRAFPTVGTGWTTLSVETPGPLPPSLPVYAADGRRVAIVRIDPVGPGRGRGRWSYLSLHQGIRVPNGVYFVGRGELRTRIVHVR